MKNRQRQNKKKLLSKKPEPLQQKPHGGKMHMNTNVNNEKPRRAFKLPSAKFDAVSSTSRTMSPLKMNKQSNAQIPTKSYSTEIANLNKLLQYLKPFNYMQPYLFLNVTYKPST